MSPEQNMPPPAPLQNPRFKISLDWWSVLTALALIALVLVGIIPSVPW